jgi:hypothetical protein
MLFRTRAKVASLGAHGKSVTHWVISFMSLHTREGLNDTYKFSSYLKENTLHHYKDQSDHAVKDVIAV